jgi:hypothetical protein
MNDEWSGEGDMILTSVMSDGVGRRIGFGVLIVIES